MIHSAHAVGEHRFGHGTRRTQAGRHSRRRCCGYSRLMSADEEGTHERLKAHFRALVNPKITEHGGRIVKSTGDGLLAGFPSAVNAVRCAAETQRTMIDRNADTPEERRIKFRIGVPPRKGKLYWRFCAPHV
jgi:class 3 adenylate cyclase